MKARSMLVVVCGLWLVVVPAGKAMSQAPAAEKVITAQVNSTSTGGGDVPLLQIVGTVRPGGPYAFPPREEGSGTIWRYFETWQTEAVRSQAGKIIRVDPLKPRRDFDANKLWLERKAGDAPKDTEYQIQEAEKITGSAFPPADWTQPDFDDTAWIRTANPMQMSYRSLAMVCLRGKFTVNDPAQVSELRLDASIQGGAVVYMNGQEVGRFHLPEGKIVNETPAEDYPKEAFFTPSGDLLPQSVNYKGWVAGGVPVSEADLGRKELQKDSDLAARYQKRFRHINLKIPATALRKGSNVLAIEVHRAPALEATFTRFDPKRMGYNLTEHYMWFWNRAGIEEVNLTAKAQAGAVVGNITRPAGYQVWNWPIAERVDPKLYGDPNEPTSAIRLAGARNGVFAGQVVVSATSVIRALKVEVSDLKGQGGQTIEKSSVRIRYPQWYKLKGMGAFDPLEDSVPAEIPCIPAPRGGSTGVAMQPVWLTVEVPKDAKAGDYSGAARVSAEGLDPVDVPIQLHVSDWNLPDSKDFATYMAMIQSPDTLAIRYGVPMWSKEHWELIDQCFQILGTISTKELNVTLVRRAHFGNEHGMVWFVKKPDGTFEPCLDVAEKYIDTAVRHLGKIPTAVFYVIEADADGCPWVTEFDPSTGMLKNAKAPPWGTAEARAFWKPAFEGFRKILAEHGMEKSLCVGYHAAGGNGPEAPKGCIADLKEIAPEARWVRVCHFWAPGRDRLESGPNGNPWGRVALVTGNYGVMWDPDTDKPFFGWRNPYPATAYTRGSIDECTLLREYRHAPEMVLLGGREAKSATYLSDELGKLGARGFGPWGADFWPVLGSGRDRDDIVARYNDPGAGTWDPRSCWSTTALNGSIAYLVGEGTAGPVPSVRTEILREGLQEAEARMFCQNALLDENLMTKLGPDLAKRCKEVCDNRTRALRYETEFRASGASKNPITTHFLFHASEWQKLSRELYEMAAEVGKALAGRARPDTE